MIFITIVDPASINNSYHFHLEIKPNPTKDFINISIQDEYELVEIYTISGHRMEAMKVNIDSQSKIMRFDISHYPNGLYILKIRGKKEKKVSKIIKI